MATLVNNAVQKALTTLQRAKSFLDIAGDSKDTILTILINQATGSIETMINRRLLRQTYTDEQYDGTGSNTLVLKQWPLISVTRLQVNTSGDATPSWETIDTSRYHVYSDGRIVLQSPVGGFLDIDAGNFLAAPNKYRATYVAGYLINFDQENDPAQHTLPGDLEYACLKLAGAMINSRKAEGISSARVGDVSMTYKAEALKDPELKEILAAHRSVTI